MRLDLHPCNAPKTLDMTLDLCKDADICKYFVSTKERKTSTALSRSAREKKQSLPSLRCSVFPSSKSLPTSRLYRYQHHSYECREDECPGKVNGCRGSIAGNIRRQNRSDETRYSIQETRHACAGASYGCGTVVFCDTFISIKSSKKAGGGGRGEGRLTRSQA